MAKHRSHGEGSIGYMESKKLWVARITLPNGKRIAKYDGPMEGGRVLGHDDVRKYWTRQWSMINPTITPNRL